MKNRDSDYFTEKHRDKQKWDGSILEEGEGVKRLLRSIRPPNDTQSHLRKIPPLTGDKMLAMTG